MTLIPEAQLLGSSSMAILLANSTDMLSGNGYLVPLKRLVAWLATLFVNGSCRN